SVFRRGGRGRDGCDGGGVGPNRFTCRVAVRAHPRRDSRSSLERPACWQASQYAQPHVPGRAWREHVDCARSRRYRSFDGLGVRRRSRRAVARVARDGPQRCRRAQLAQDQPRLEQHRAGNRSRRGAYCARVAARRCRRTAVGGERTMRPRVLVAMSGGVDSSVAAAIVREQGYDVVGVAMRLVPEPSSPAPAARRATCCSHDDFEDARRVAEQMDFPFYVIDLRADFAARVVDNFVSEYLGGRTPNPCVMCNREIKFDRLWSRARALNADYVATGHYARIVQGADHRFHLLRAADETKDQSYFLFTLGQDELARTIFPLGAMTKTEVRARARALGLATADKPESQEICFV